MCERVDVPLVFFGSSIEFIFFSVNKLTVLIWKRWGFLEKENNFPIVHHFNPLRGFVCCGCRQPVRRMATPKADGGAAAMGKPVMVVAVDDSEHSFHALQWTLLRFFSSAAAGSTLPFKLVVVHSRPAPTSIISLSATGNIPSLLALFVGEW